MGSLGQELKKQRESRNISLDEMASSTKIVGRYLQALEEDRLDVMPGGFFIKGIIRTYAKYIGLDEAEVLARYRDAGVLEGPAKTRPAEGRSEPEGDRPATEGRNRFFVWVLVTAAALLVLAALTLLRRPSQRARPARAVPQAAAATVPQTQASPLQAEPKQEPAPTPPVQEAAKEEWKGLTLEMSFQEETWIQVYADGALKVSGLFEVGQKARAVAEKEILIGVLGNAGGLTFLLNGRPGKTLGRSGEVLNNVRITTDNLKEFLQETRPPRPAE